MTTVRRHEFPLGNIGELMELTEPRFWKEVGTLQNQPLWFSNLLLKAVNRIGLYCSITPDASTLESWEATVTAMQLGSALFVSAQAETGTFEYRINHDIRNIRYGAGPRAYAGHWVTAFYLAAVCREPKRMWQLSQVPVSLLRQAEGAYDRYMYDWVEALQAYRLEQGDFGDKLVTAMENTDPARLRHAPRETVLKINYPPMNLLAQIAKRDESAFNTELAQALEWHKDYWTSSQDRSRDNEGVIALGPLAMACLAKDAGFTITVESEYLPSALLDGDWLNEFPT
ncbi:immunity 49 family protein [Streptomyces luteolus]|uniref:Immunity 49 family protein n=1 Tax=Streptomyces luteolus TaxID=3043615 RepID=A0ABT6SYR9_9ACTN|nr:immunity 49 family protein [Streptomyces sp. B-S-A12]MDI3420756.1 immunity 49 family protein [Streptomyces sp. B-S-A12]